MSDEEARVTAQRDLVVSMLGSDAVAALANADGPVVVGCSGGADSFALLALAWVVAATSTIVVHVDHGAREGSGAEADVVAAVARRFGMRFAACCVSVPTGPSFEARAREARYDALMAAAAGYGAKTIAVGHTRDDQAETVLLNVLRGAATAGLAGIWARRGPIVRPLLGVPRAATVELCARLMLPVVHDPMNDDIGYRRVWLRREVLPVIEAGVGRDLRAVIARQATVLQSESELLDRLARAALDRAGDPPAIAALAAEEPAIARRAIRLWLAPDVAPPSQTEVDAVVDVAGGSRTAANLAGGDTVFARRGHLERRRVVAAQAASRAPSEPVAVAFPGTTTGLGWILESWVERAAPLAWPDGRWTCVVDADAMPDEAELRSARPAERFQPLGMAGTKTVATARAESGVAPGARGGGVVVATTGEVLWVVGYRIAERLRVTPRTRRYLWIAAINAEDSSA